MDVRRMIDAPADLVFLIALAGAVGVLITASLTFDRLVRTEYETDRAAWNDDGKPRGFFWQAPECTYFGTAWATNRLLFTWLFKTPEWAAPDPALRAAFRKYRYGVLMWNVMIIVALLGCLVYNA